MAIGEGLFTPFGFRGKKQLFILRTDLRFGPRGNRSMVPELILKHRYPQAANERGKRTAERAKFKTTGKYPLVWKILLAQMVDILSHITADGVEFISIDFLHERIPEPMNGLHRCNFVHGRDDDCHLVARSIASVHVDLDEVLVFVQGGAIEVHQDSRLFL